MLMGIILLPVAATEALRYRANPADPGTRNPGLPVGIAAALLIGVPLLAVLASIAVHELRKYWAWKKTLPSGERLAVSVAELAAMEGAHLAWRHHNKAVSERLTASVMGEHRGDVFADRGDS